MNDMYFDYSKRTAFYFVVFLLLYETTAYITNDMIMPGMIEVVRSFSAPDTMVSTSLTAFIFGGASLQIFLGPLSDRFGRRPVLIFGVAFFLLCTVLIGLSQSMHQFILARFFQGMGLCFISVIGYATLQEIFVETYAVRMISIMNSITVIAPLTGPLLGAVVIMYCSWRIIFLFIGISTCIALIGLWYCMPETVGIKKTDGTINQITSLQYQVVKGNYVSLLKNKRFMLGSLALGFSSVPIIAWIGTSPLILIAAAKFSVLEYACWQIPIFLAAIIGNMAMRKYISRLPLLRLTAIGSSIMVASLILTAVLTFFFHQSYLCLIIGITLYSVGLGFTTAPLNRITLFSTMIPKGTASAMLSLILMLTTAIGNEIAGWLYADYNNLYFGLYIAICGCVYCCLYNLMNKDRVVEVQTATVVTDHI